MCAGRRSLKCMHPLPFHSTVHLRSYSYLVYSFAKCPKQSANIRRGIATPTSVITLNGSALDGRGFGLQGTEIHAKDSFDYRHYRSDGSCFPELLLNKGYAVHSVKPRSSSFNAWRIDDVIPDWHERDARLFLHFADVSESTSLVRLLYPLQPGGIYNLGA